jgi:uncharacterized protein
MPETKQYRVTFIASLGDISAHLWNSLCASNYPFCRHEFLYCLELSGSVSQRAGWLSQHLLLWCDDKLIAAMPLYVKSHSYGEYVFDWAWADAYKRYGLDYYPKLVSAIPFTPCTGVRVLCAENIIVADVMLHIVPAIKAHAEYLKASSWHCLFPSPSESALITQHNTCQRLGCQFHWYNRGYESWDDFVNTMTSRKRKTINKERRHVHEQGIEFTVKEGVAIGEEDWQLFYQLYCNTYLKRSGHKGYLTELFFTLLGQHCAAQLVMIIAQQQQHTIAASLYFKDETTLYGRYWGCLEEYNFLHFETCYYQGIDYAIKHRLQHFDGGAQGEHKIQRGFEAIITYSNHWLMHEGFQQSITHVVQQEADSVRAYQQDALQYLPFKEQGSV